MSTGPHTRLVRLFSAAVELPEEQRSAFLEAHAASAEERAEVERLLHCDAAAGSFIAEPVDVGSRALAAAIAEDVESESPLPERVGRYVIEGELGRGAMGVVYRARQDGTGQTVAVKLLRNTWATPRAARRFSRETRILGHLEHPGIARILDAGAADVGSEKRAYLAMECVEGRDVVRYAGEEELGHEERARLLADLCDALDYAHEQGVIHRDVKPENVLVTEDGRVKVLDFGVARMTEADLQWTTLRTGEAQIVGTLSYMSPEQAEGAVESLDRRSDVYSLGVLAYELLGGRRPVELEGRTIVEAARLVQEVDPPRLSSVQRGVPRDLEVIVHKALEKEPERRYGTAAAMAADLRRWLRHEPITARPASTVYALRKLARRHRGLTVGLASTFLVLVVGTAVSAYLAARAVRASESARWQTYLAVVALASSELQTGSFERARQHLEKAPPEHRGMEWRILWNLAEQSRFTLIGHAYNVWDVAVTPDGERAYSCAGDATVREWDLATGTAARVLTDHGERVFSVAVDPSGARMVSASASGTILLRDATSLESVAVLEGHAVGVFGLAFSVDGSILASGANDGSLALWDAKDGRLLRELDGHDERIWSIAFAPEEPLFATASLDGTVKLWDVATGMEVAGLAADAGAVFGVSFSPDGERVALATEKGELQLWDVASAERVASVPAHDGELGCVEFAPNGRCLVTGARDGTLAVWDAGTLARIGTRRGHSDWIRSVAFSPDGTLLVSGATDDVVRVWDASRLEERLAPDARPDVSSFALGPQPDQLFVCLRDGRVELQELTTGRVLTRVAELEAPGSMIHHAPAGILIFSGNTEKEVPVRVVDVSTGRVQLELTGNRSAVNRAGTLVATVEKPFGVIALYDARSGERLRTFGQEGEYVAALAFDASGERLLASGRKDCAVRVWDVATGREVGALEGHVDTVTRIVVEPAGEAILTCGVDRVAHLWNARTFERVGTLAGHGATVVDAAFGPDGERIATVSEDGKARLWSRETLEELAVIALGGSPWDVAFSADGNFLITVDHDRRMHVLDGRAIGH